MKEKQLPLLGKDPYRRGFGPSGPVKRTFVELTDESPCPIGKRWKGVPMKDVPANFLDWFMGQDWRFKFPALVDYVERNRKAIDQDLRREGRI
jgi:uncharacterized protein (DUF3820 family)